MKPQPTFFIPPDNNSNSVMAGGDTDGVTLKESNVRCIHSTSIIWHVWRRQNLRQHIICMCTKVLLVTILIETIEHRSIAFSHVPTAVIDSLATSWMSLMHMCSSKYIWDVCVLSVTIDVDTYTLFVITKQNLSYAIKTGGGSPRCYCGENNASLFS